MKRIFTITAGVALCALLATSSYALSPTPQRQTTFGTSTAVLVLQDRTVSDGIAAVTQHQTGKSEFGIAINFKGDVNGNQMKGQGVIIGHGACATKQPDYVSTDLGASDPVEALANFVEQIDGGGIGASSSVAPIG